MSFETREMIFTLIAVTPWILFAVVAVFSAVSKLRADHAAAQKQSAPGSRRA